MASAVKMMEREPMHRLELNLARRPAENRRRVWIVWGGLLALLLAAILGLSLRLGFDYAATRSTARRTAAERAQLAPLEARQAAFAAWLRQPRNQQELDRLRYLNQLIAYKSISWTHLFQRLEGLMPMPVRLIAIQPTEKSGKGKTSGQYTMISMEVDAPRVRDLVQLLEKLELDNEFSQPNVNEERRETTDSGAPAGVVMQFTVQYHPLPLSDLAAPAATGAGNAQ